MVENFILPKDWEWKFVAKYVRTKNSNEVELIVNLGFDMMIHMVFVLEGVEKFYHHSLDANERSLAYKCSSFIDEQLRGASHIIVYSSRLEGSNNYMGNILYTDKTDAECYFLSNELISSGILDGIN